MVGEASCGKSCIIEGLKLAMCKLKNEPGYRNVEVNFFIQDCEIKP
jgi:hypothetical protein